MGRVAGKSFRAQAKIVVNHKGLSLVTTRKRLVPLNAPIFMQEPSILEKLLMTTQRKLNPKVVPLKQRLEARKGGFRQGTRRPDLGWKSKPITYHLSPTRLLDPKLIAKIHQGRASLEIQKREGKGEHVGACSLCSYGSLMVKIPPISYGATNAMGEPRHMQVHQGAALGQELGGPIHMKLGQVWEPPIANLSVSCLVLVGIKDSREIPRFQRLSFKVQKATHIPKTSKLQALLRFLSCKIGYLSNRNLMAMTQKRRLLEGQPKGAIQKGFHRPFSLANQLQATDIERPIGQQLRVFTHRQRPGSGVKGRQGPCK
jgi:hypothetical protein